MSKKLKHIIRDIFIRLISFSGVSWFYRKVLFRKKPLVRVLCFHDVSDERWFREVVGLLTSQYHVLSPEDFANKNFANDKINLLLTFDDGYQSWVDVVLPVLSQFNVKGLFFVCSGLLDAADGADQVESFMTNQLLIKPREPLSWEGARTLCSSGHVIGGHTANHYNLMQTDKNLMETEIVLDKANLSDGLQLNLEDFAYPFGTKKHFDASVKKVVKEAGYKRIYTAISGFMSDDYSRIPRTLVDSELTADSIGLWIEGSYDIFSFLK